VESILGSNNSVTVCADWLSGRSQHIFSARNLAHNTQKEIFEQYVLYFLICLCSNGSCFAVRQNFIMWLAPLSVGSHDNNQHLYFIGVSVGIVVGNINEMASVWVVAEFGKGSGSSVYVFCVAAVLWLVEIAGI
jgi:hypothetical protein